MKTSHQGFTLPELLIVLVITGILGMGAMQSWQRWQQRQQLRETAQLLQGFLLRLRSYANSHNSNQLLWLSVDAKRCLGSGEKPSQGCIVGHRFHFIVPYPSVSFSRMQGEPGFYGRRNMAKAGSIELVSEAGRLRVIISARARIRICQPEEEGCE